VKFFKHNFNKIINYLPIIVVFSMMLVMAVPVYAAYNYYAPISITNNSTNNYGDIPVLVSMNNTQLASLDYILATGLDTDVQTTTSIPYSLSATRLGVFEEFNAYDSRDLAYYLGYTPNQTSYPIITGYNGYVTTADDASLEPGADFTIDYSGYVDTSAGNVGEVIAEKDGAVTLYVSSAGNIAGGFDGEDIVSIIPMTPSANVAPVATGAWTDVDCTALGVPDSASGVVIHIVNTNAAYQEYGLRKNGSADDRHSDFMNSSHNWAMIGTDANGIFEAYIESASIEMYVTGYTNPATVIFNTNADNISLGATGAWTDIDCSAICPDAKAILVEVTNLGATALVSGLRPNGSAATSTLADIGIKVHDFYLVGCDTNQIIEGYIESVAVDFYVIGYITDGITMFTDPVDKSLGGTGAWTDIDCSASTDSSTSGLIFSITNVSAAYGFRKNGSAEDINRNGYNFASFMSIVECDGNQVVEGKIANLAQDFWLWGYFGKAKTLVTSACASGEHDIRLDYDGANLDLFIDDMGVAVDTEAIVTTVADNANDWIIGSNATPYIDSITFDIGGATALWYEPVTIILADTATDRSGSGNHGDITWGANPAGIEITILGLVSSETFTASGDDGSIPDPLPIPSAFNITATNTTGITTFWMYDLVNRAAEHLGFSAQTMYVLIGLIAATGVGFGALIGTGNMLGFAIGFGTTAGLFAATGVMPWWIIIIIIAIAAMGIYTWKRG